MTDPPTEHSHQAPPRIAVVGGGITGLAAAHRVTELLPRAELVLFEASPRLGGVIDTIHRDGFLIERSADNFLTRLPVALELCRRLGIADELIPTDETRRRAFVVRNGRLLPIPDGFFLMSPRKLGPMLTSPILSLRGKLRLLAEPFISRRAVQDESVASFARRRLGREIFERLVQPLVAGIYTADPEKLSMAAAMPEFLALEREHGSLLRAAHRNRDPALRTGHFSDQSTDTASGARYALFVAPKDGMATLINAFADRLPPSTIQLNTRVTNIQRHPGGRWQLDFEPKRAGSSSTPAGAEAGTRHTGPPFGRCPPGAGSPARLHPQSAIHNPQSLFDALILAVPAHTAARLVESCDAELSAELAAIEYAGCAVVNLGFDRRQIGHPLDGFGFVVPQVEQRRIIAASFSSQKFAGRAPHHAVLIRVFIGGALQPESLELADDDLRQLAIDELRDLLHVTGEPLVTDIARWPRAMPQYHVGHLARIARIEQLAARHPHLALAGNAYHGVGIPQCIASAEAAAESVASSLAGRPNERAAPQRPGTQR